MKEPATPPAKRANPKNSITLAAAEEELPKEVEKRADFSIEFTINIPKVEEMNGIQSVNVK